MSTKHQRIPISIPKVYGPAERVAIGAEIVDRIVSRTKSGVDKRGEAFSGYSKAYEASLAFKIGGKRKGMTPNLTLSGDMLDALKVLNHKSGQIVVGYEKGSTDNAKADGNIRGTYGTDTAKRSRAKDFLGITRDELREIFARYPTTEDQRDISKVRAEQVVASIEYAEDLLE